MPQPRVEKLLIEYIAGLSLPVVLLSTTTNRFIDYELGLNKQYFNKIYSCVDDFSTGGKTADVFGAIAREWGVKPNEIVHIGDNQEMDIDNALKAGVRAILYTGNPGAVVAQINHLLDGVDEGR
ncbi:HAD-IA family hydrolase [Candidatus Saccharibacteria bacterium]|nr:MAG: HAD-IA family hydrolase [Candidatus Saccharibacteria bacterium]